MQNSTCTKAQTELSELIPWQTALTNKTKLFFPFITAHAGMTQRDGDQTGLLRGKASVGHLHWDSGVCETIQGFTVGNSGKWREFSVSLRMRFLCVNQPFQSPCGKLPLFFAPLAVLFFHVTTSTVPGWGGRKSSLSLLISPIAGKQACVITAALQSFRV